MPKFRVMAKETWDYYLEAESAKEAERKVIEEMEGKCDLWTTEVVSVEEYEDHEV